ncbi:MAG: hypothetical protein V4529_16610 [Gemmatimonadota bacterium]
MAKAKTEEPVIINNKADPPEILATSIREVAEAARKLLATRLTKRAILVLLKDSCGLPMHEIEKVLDHAASLDRYVKR